MADGTENKVLQELQFRRNALAGLGSLRALSGGAVISSTPGKMCPELVAEFTTQAGAGYFVALDAAVADVLDGAAQLAQDAGPLLIAIRAAADTAGVTGDTKHFPDTDAGLLAAAISDVVRAADEFRRRNNLGDGGR